MFDFASRITKLDAVSLDEAFLSFIKKEVTELLNTFVGSDKLQKCSPEINVIVKFAVWKMTTATGSTLGQKLLGIRYAQVTPKLKYLFLLEAVVPYVVERIRSFRNLAAAKIIQAPLMFAESAVKVLSVVNFCLFLVQNRYPTVATRVLELPIESKSRPFGAPASYIYQIRELLWHQFADLFLQILPMIELHRLKQSFTKIFQKCLNKRPTTPPPSSLTKPDSMSNTTSSSTTSDSVAFCNICNDAAVVPHKIANDVYCYYCYQAHCEDGF